VECEGLRGNDGGDFLKLPPHTVDAGEESCLHLVSKKEHFSQ
jgi:hypothetical protein